MVVTSFIKDKMADCTSLTLKDLPQKLSMLLALIDLHLLDLQFKSSSSKGIIFRVGGLSKTRCSGPPRSVII